MELAVEGVKQKAFQMPSQPAFRGTRLCYQIASSCFLSTLSVWFLTSKPPPRALVDRALFLLFLSPPFQKLEDWFAALSLNQELGIPLPAELDELHQSLSRLHWPKDGSPNQSSKQPLSPVAASPDSSSMTDSGT